MREFARKSKIFDLVPDDKLVDTKSYPYQKYEFEKFNRVQSTLLSKIGYKNDYNIICATATSTGKTIVAEILIGEVLNNHKKVLYVSPLRSLTTEKYNDWKDKFYNYNVSIVTGDYVMDDKRVQELKNADIICLTSEMVDSRTRKIDSEKSSWLKEVGLIIGEEFHIIALENRGPCVEVGFMRFTEQVPEARILILSATLPNVSDFVTWISSLNGKRTYAINSDWRPVKLSWNFVQILGNSYQRKELDKTSNVIDIVEKKPFQNFLVFVHTKKLGRDIKKKLLKRGIECDFHYSELKKQKREKLVKDFDKGKLRVLVATSTLAWGVTTCARNVIIAGTTRGINNVEVLDIIQMGGRAGRLGKAPDGFVYLICDKTDLWEYKIKNQGKLSSKLLNDTLGFHILAEIRLGKIKNYETLKEWYSRSFANLQSIWDDHTVNKAINNLEKIGMIKILDGGLYEITFLGIISAVMYYLPSSVYFMYKYFKTVDKYDWWENDEVLAYGIGGIPVFQAFIPQNEQQNVKTFMFSLIRYAKSFEIKLESSLVAAYLYRHIKGERVDRYIGSVIGDTERIVQVLELMSKRFNWEFDSEAIVKKIKKWN